MHCSLVSSDASAVLDSANTVAVHFCWAVRLSAGSPSRIGAHEGVSTIDPDPVYPVRTTLEGTGRAL